MGRAAALGRSVLRQLPCAVLLVAATLAQAQTQTPVPVPVPELAGAKARELFEAGERQREGRQFDAAVQSFTQVTRLEPESRLGWFHRGLAYRDLGDCARAIQDFSAALQRAQNHFDALYQRGNCQQKLGQYRDAIADYSAASTLPDRLDDRLLAVFARAEAWRRSGNLEAALADYDRVAGYRTDAFVLRPRSWVHFYRGNWKAAYDDAARVLASGEATPAAGSYAVILGYLAQYRARGKQDADRFLQEWLPRIAERPWPGPVIHFLGGRLDETALLAAVRDVNERNEARAYVGVLRVVEKKLPQGAALLTEVAKSIDPAFWEYDLAHYELRRLGRAKPGDRRLPHRTPG